MRERWRLKSDHGVECEAEELCTPGRPKHYGYKVDVRALTAVGIVDDGWYWFMPSDLFEKLWERVPDQELRDRVAKAFASVDDFLKGVEEIAKFRRGLSVLFGQVPLDPVDGRKDDV